MRTAVIQNLLHNKNIEIFILKEPAKDVGCYEEVKFWLNKGWIKLWKENNDNISDIELLDRAC